MNIQFEGIRQFTPCMIFTSIDANVFRIVLAAMNFAFANFIDRRQQGIDIDEDGFHAEMKKQKERARAERLKKNISASR